MCFVNPDTKVECSRRGLASSVASWRGVHAWDATTDASDGPASTIDCSPTVSSGGGGCYAIAYAAARPIDPAGRAGRVPVCRLPISIGCLFLSPTCTSSGSSDAAGFEFPKRRAPSTRSPSGFCSSFSRLPALSALLPFLRRDARWGLACAGPGTLSSAAARVTHLCGPTTDMIGPLKAPDMAGPGSRRLASVCLIHHPSSIHPRIPQRTPS